MDRSSRPELQLGSVDFLVNDDYCVRPLQEPIHVFAIDISHKAVANGVTIASIRSVRAALYKLRQLEEQYGTSSNSAVDEALRAAAYSANAATRTNHKTNPKNSANSKTTATTGSSTSIRAAIVTFNHNIQYYTVNMASAEPIKMFEVSGEDPLCPLPPDLFLMSVSSADTALEHLLQRIPELVASMQGSSEEGYDRYNYNNNDMSMSTNPKKLSRNMSGTGFGGYSPRGIVLCLCVMFLCLMLLTFVVPSSRGTVSVNSCTHSFCTLFDTLHINDRDYTAQPSAQWCI